MVHYRRIRHEKYLPAFFPETHAPVEVLAVKKITLIPWANIPDCLLPHQHECAGNSLHF